MSAAQSVSSSGAILTTASIRASSTSPRDRYNTEVRQRIEQIVLEGFEGRKVESYVQISGSNHARVHVVVRTDPEQRRKVDFAAIESRIAAAALTWTDRLREVLAERRGEAAGLLLATRYRRAFPMAYEEDVAPRRRAPGPRRPGGPARSAASHAPEAVSPGPGASRAGSI